MDLVRSRTETQRPSAEQGKNTVGRSSFNWDALVRNGLLNEAVDALLNGPGVLLDGPVGSGRKTLAAAVLRHVQGNTLVIDLSFAERQRATFEFKKILDGLEFQDEEARFQAVAIAHAMLQEESSGLPVIVFVPESLELSPRGASFLSSLALANTVRLLCLSTMLSTAEHQMQDDLLGSVRLHRIQLDNLTLNETHQKLSSALGAEVSRTAAHQMWKATAGHLPMISALAQDWIDIGYLVKSGDSWVVNGDEQPLGPRSHAIWSHLVTGLHGKELEVVELLAQSKEIPLSVMMGVCDADDVDSVYAKGLVEIRGEYTRSIRLGKALNDKVVAGLTPPGRARELLTRYLGNGTNASLMKPLIRLGWEQSAGIVSDPGLVRAAAAQALSERRIELCLIIVGNNKTPDREIDLIRLEAMVYGGFLEHASELLEVLQSRFGSELPTPRSGFASEDVDFLIRLNTAAVRIQASTKHTNYEQAHAGFLAVRRNIGEWKKLEGSDAGQLDFLAGQIDLTELEVLYHVGWPSWSENLPYTHPHLRTHDQLRWQYLHNLHSIRRGQVELALKRGSELLFLRPSSYPEPENGENLKQGFVNLCLVAGEWNKALALVEAAWIGGKESSRITELSGLYSSLINVFAGRYEEALVQLRTEIEQLKAADPDAQLPLAVAASALAASSSDIPLAIELLADLERIPGTWSWDVQQGVVALRSVAEFNVGRHNAAREALSQSAEENAARGALNLELTSRAMLLRLGYGDEAERVLGCAEKIDGSFAGRMVTLLKHPKTNEQAEDAQAPVQDWSMGRLTIVGSIDAKGYQPSASGTAERFSAEGRESEKHVLQVTPLPTSDVIAALTNRQRAIVTEAITGASSRDISRKLGIGVRTVEGHLYQIYQRLHVSSRQELAAMYKDAIETAGS